MLKRSKREEKEGIKIGPSEVLSVLDVGEEAGEEMEAEGGVAGESALEVAAELVEVGREGGMAIVGDANGASGVGEQRDHVADVPLVLLLASSSDRLAFTFAADAAAPGGCGGAGGGGSGRGATVAAEGGGGGLGSGERGRPLARMERSAALEENHAGLWMGMVVRHGSSGG